MRQAEKYITDGLHPRSIVESFEVARKEALSFLDTFKSKSPAIDRETLRCLAKTNLRTKISQNFVDSLSDDVIEAVLTIKKEKDIDLHMIEIIKIQQGTTSESRLIKGLVLDHGGRHPDMPKRLENCYILNLNVSLEYEKTEINSGFFYSSAEQRDKLVRNERLHVDQKLQKIIELKRTICSDGNSSFVIINQKGIDPLSLDVLAKEGILALRRAKRRNAERIMLCCGGTALNSLDSMVVESLGYAGLVYEQTIGEDKYTFIEKVKSPRSATMLIKGPYAHILNQVAESVKGCIKSIKNAILDETVIPGAGSFSLLLYKHLLHYSETTSLGKARLGIQAFADAMLIIPKALATTAGLDQQEVITFALEKMKDGKLYGIDLSSGKTIDPLAEGILDDYRALRHAINSCTVIASNLLLVDEIIRAGRSSLKSESVSH